MDDILKKYPNDVKVVVKNFPLSFHKEAKRAAQYSLAAHKQGKYKDFYHALMKDFRKLKGNADYSLEVAESLGLDIDQLKRDADSKQVIDQIESEINQLRNSGIPRLSVPKFLVAGKEPQGRDIGTFSAMIDAELKKGK